jgi:uncharacterized membrane protein YkvI
MGVFLSVLVLAFELIVNIAAGVWAMAFLGFMGDAHRSQPVSMVGWMIGSIYLLVAALPTATTLWLIYRRFFSKDGIPTFANVSSLSAYWLPVILLLGAGFVCAGLLMIQDNVGFAKRVEQSGGTFR